MIQRISEVDQPVVGRFYLVPCVVDLYGDLIPIIGPEHDDKEYIGVEARHYHRDLRFLSDREINCITRRYGTGFSCSREQLAMASILITDHVLVEPSESRVKCRRAMPDFPTRIKLFPAPWLSELEAAYPKLLSCLRCPHRGMPLKGMPVKDGKVICPGHGLQFDINTGEMVSRLEAKG